MKEDIMQYAAPPPSRPRCPPVSNTERQRQFRERNPGYYGRLHRKRNAEIDAYGAARLAAATESQPAPGAAQAPGAGAGAGPGAPLMLPAPPKMIAIELPLFATLQPEPAARRQGV